MLKIKDNWNNIKHKQLWIDSMIGMTWGFIATLVVGTIVGLFGIHQDNTWSHMTNSVKATMTYLTPFAIGAGVAFKAKLKPLQLMAIMIATGIAAHSAFIPSIHNDTIHWTDKFNKSTNAFESIKVGLDLGIINLKGGVALPGDVFGAWISSVMLVYFFLLVKWDFMLDIIFLPLLGALFGIVNSLYLTYATSSVLVMLEWCVEHSINESHTWGILLAPAVGVIMGLALSMPTSSAAMAFALKLHGDAATAAMAATAAQMISFGAMTYLATGSIQKSIAVGFGTSMLQMKNFMRRPQLLIIPTAMSALMAIAAVAAVPLDFVPGRVTSGMGTCGLYGQIFTLEENGWSSWQSWVNVLVFQLFTPALLTAGIGYFAMNNKLWIKKEWMEI